MEVSTRCSLSGCSPGDDTSSLRPCPTAASLALAPPQSMVRTTLHAPPYLQSPRPPRVRRSTQLAREAGKKCAPRRKRATAEGGARARTCKAFVCNHLLVLVVGGDLRVQLLPWLSGHACPFPIRWVSTNPTVDKNLPALQQLRLDGPRGKGSCKSDGPLRQGVFTSTRPDGPLPSVARLEANAGRSTRVGRRRRDGAT